VFSGRRRTWDCQRRVEDLEEQPRETLHCEDGADAPKVILRVAGDRRLSSRRHVILRLIARHGVDFAPAKRAKGDKEEDIKVSSSSNVPLGLFDVVKYRSPSQLLITFSTLTCVVFPLSRHVLIKTVDYRR